MSNEQNRSRNKPIAFYMGAITLAVFLLMSAIIAFVSYKKYQTAFHEYSNALCISNNAQASYLMDGDLIEQFARTLTVDDDYISFVERLDHLRGRINARYFIYPF